MIFREFSQVSYEINLHYGGSGLGLNISQKLLQLHGSEMQVSSEAGKGSIFSFEVKLGVNKEQAKKSRRISKEQTPQLFKSARLLIVDDNPTNIFIISEYLQQWNLSYDSVGSGREAIEAVQNSQFELVLLDLHMPGMDGYETAKAIRNLSLSSQPVIIALSASGRGDVNIKQKRAGINDYVPKPFRPAELFDALAHHLEVVKNEPEKTVPKETVEEEGKTEGETKVQDTVKYGKHPSFNIARFIKMANNQPDYLDKFLTNTANAFEQYKKTFEKAAAKNSAEELGELFHKSTMSIYYVQANILTGLMEDALELFSEATVDPAQRDKKVLEVSTEFDIVINGLRSIDPHDLLQQEK